MIPFEELCAALDRHRGKSAPPPAPAAPAPPAHSEEQNATRMDMQAPSIDVVSGAPDGPETTGEIDLADVVDD
jgi:hypothetical protein